MRGNFLIISCLLSFFKEIRVKNKDVVSADLERMLSMVILVLEITASLSDLT